MSDVKSLIRIAFGIVSGYIVITSLIGLIQFFSIFSQEHFKYPLLAMAGFLVGTVLILGLIVWQFVIEPDRWIARILPKIESNTVEANIDWLVVSYRLAAVVAGILLLYYSISSVLSTTASFLIMFRADSNYMDHFRNVWFFLVAGIIHFIFGIWLLLGAPQLVNWHVKKIREMAAGKMQ